MNLTATGQADATWLYPAVTDAELADQDQLVVNYRRSMGRNRIFVGLLVFSAIAFITDYVQRGPRKAA